MWARRARRQTEFTQEQSLVGQVPARAKVGADTAATRETRSVDLRLGFSLTALSQAVRIFGGAAAVAFVGIVVLIAVAPNLGTSFVAALQRIYFAPGDLVRKYINALFAIILGNCLAAGASSSLGAVGAGVLARVQQSSDATARDYGALGRVSYVLMDLLCRLSAALIPPLGRVADFSARTAAAVAALAPRLSLVCSGSVLGIYLGAELATGWVAGLWATIGDLAGHAVFELPAAWMAAAIGITASERFVRAAQRGPSALRGAAREFLTSAPYVRAIGLVVGLILVAAAIEVRGLQ